MSLTEHNCHSEAEATRGVGRGISFILFLIISFFATPLSFADDLAQVWEEGQRARQEIGNHIGEYLGKVFERVRDEKDPLKAWEGYLKIHKEIPEEFLKEGGETVRVVAWREMKRLLRRNGEELFSGRLRAEPPQMEFLRFYDKAMEEDGGLTPLDVFHFSWRFSPWLPTFRGGEWYEKIGDALFERGDFLRAYAHYKAIQDYSIAYEGGIQNQNERILKKLTTVKEGLGQHLNRIEKVSALEGLRLTDGTVFRLVTEERELLQEKIPYLEITFVEGTPPFGNVSKENTQAIRKRIYDYDFESSHLLTSKKYGPLLIRDEDKILLMLQVGEAFLIFDMNGMLLEKKPVTEEIASRYGIKSLHELLFAKDDFAAIPAGIFKMGSPPNEEGRDSDETLQTVKITKDFYLQRTEVTQLQWYLMMGEAPSYFKEKEYCEEDWDEELQICPNHPVEQISWNDVQVFIQKLNEMQTKYTYGLPMEAEWEYAARLSGVGEVERRKFLTPEGSLDIRESGWAKMMYGFGNSEDRLEQYAWYCKNSARQTHSVLDRRIKPIGGLYNMHGNVWEWVSDWYGEYPTGTVVDPEGSPSGSRRVIRGGDSDSFPRGLRSASRGHNSPDFCGGFLGFRLLR